jgi:hypothetical protein
MATFLLQSLKVVWHARVDHFLLSYAVVIGLSVIFVVWYVKRPAVPLNAANVELAVSEIKKERWVWAIAAITLALLILVGYFIVVLKWEAFANDDEAHFTLYILQGKHFGPGIWPQLGRFYPLYDEEFNLLSSFTRSVLGFHALPIAQLAIVAGIFLFLNRGIFLAARASMAIAYLLLPSTVTCFVGLIFPERNVVFWLACLLLFVRLFENSGSIAWAVAATVSAQNMLYYKETAFLLLLGFATGHLILRCRRENGHGWDWTRLRAKESRLDHCFILFALVFVLYYASVMMKHPNMAYADQMGFPLRGVILDYLRYDPLAFLFVAGALIRAWLILRGKITPSPFWDSLALGGVLIFAAYFRLKLFGPHYFAQVDLIAVLYLGRLIALSWKGSPTWRKLIVSAAGAVIVLQGVSMAAFQICERENSNQAKAKLADAILAQSESRPGRVLRLYFPFASTYTLTEFASYLTYRGLDLEGYENSKNPLPSGSVELVSNRFTKDAPCVNYRNFICHAGSAPVSGELVIQLPDDSESSVESNLYETGGEVLFTYEPRPRIRTWMMPELNYLHVASIRWRLPRLPDCWLHASMTLWR